MKHALFTAKEKDHRKKNIPEILFSVAFLFRRKKKTRNRKLAHDFYV